MTLIDRLKEAISYLHEDELILRNISVKSEIFPSAKPIEPIVETKEEPEKLPFNPIRKPVSKSIFNQSLNLKKTTKEAPKIVHQEQSEKTEESKVIDSFQDVRAIIKQTFKDLKLHDQIPDDKEAKILAKLYENKSQFPEVVILYEKTQAKGTALLQALSNAIDKRFVSCDCISIEEIEEKGNLDPLLKDKKIQLFICTQELLWHHPKLLSQFVETKNQSMKRLGTKDLILLLNLDIYLKDPSIKRSLWNNLMAYFKK